ASLALACLLTAWWPHAVAGFFYHSWIVGIVHLVTLGWITFSILGAIYIVGPLALRMDMPERRLDYVAYAFAVVGVAGMVAHFWIQEYGGMAWSAGTVALGIVYVTVRLVAGVRRAGVPFPVRLHIVLACVNVWIAAAMGLLIAIDKAMHFLPGFVLSNVFAHAHLAAIGWATMMVIGVGYRLLPMTLPSKMPSGRSLYASAILLETGVLGLFTTLLTGSAWAMLFAVTIVVGLLMFAAHVVWMVRTRASKPIGAPRIDFAVLHAAGAGVWLAAASAIGLWLVAAPPSSRSLHAAAAYGVVGLVGFLAQMIVAMEVRLLPLASWFWAYAGSDYREAPRSPHTMRDRQLQAIVFAAWTAGVPAIAAGMYLESAPLVAGGAWTLFAAVVLATLDNVFVIVPAVRGK
ncbi:MAG TPA: hypothetical protein VEU08_23785, partial [Vicinamibacterales bacterium]|nr:hypothetical protein [Vicinamibacterales bacterium]